MKKNRTHKKPKFAKTPYKVAGVDIITPDDVQNSASIAKARLLANKALQETALSTKTDILSDDNTKLDTANLADDSGNNAKMTANDNVNNNVDENVHNNVNDKKVNDKANDDNANANAVDVNDGKADDVNVSNANNTNDDNANDDNANDDKKVDNGNVINASDNTKTNANTNNGAVSDKADTPLNDNTLPVPKQTTPPATQAQPATQVVSQSNLLTNSSHTQTLGMTTMTTDNQNTNPNINQTANQVTDNQPNTNSQSTQMPNVADTALPKPFPKTQKSNNKKWLVACILAVLMGIGLGQCMGKKSLISNTQTTTQTVASDGSTTTTTTTSKNVDLGAVKVTANTAVATELTPTERVPAMAVEAITPQAFVINESLSAEGAIFGGESAMVGAKASGLMVEQVFVKVGDRVKKGQTLAILDDYTAKNEVLALTADKKQAEINLAKVNSDFERIQGLMDIDAISWQQYDQYKAVKMQAQAQLDGINARLDSIQNQVKNTKVVAPVSGVISEKNAEVGMMTGGGSLFGIIKTDKLEWRATIQADKRDKVFVGQKVVLGNKATGKVVRISPTANDKRELMIFVALNGTSVPIGSYQTGEFVLNQKSVLALPAKSVMSYDGKEFVWVLTDKQAPKSDDKANNNGTTLANLGVYTAKKMPLPNAKRLGDKVAVELPKDTLVIKAGGNFLSEGDLVTLTAIDKKDDESSNDNLANKPLTNETLADENSPNDNSNDNSSDKTENRE